ncbi:hypothetical protein V6N12_059633 [Hibiscus sabdariffa]|uniref:Uncharacterized protein n=1 Tax=Hibiscus sabdariffa TaxID=183260 RepID=A0ABR2EVQ4_9ROSI
MEDYSEDGAQKAEDEKVDESATDIAVVVEEDSSSSIIGSAGEEKLVSEPPSVEVSEVILESIRDVEPGDSGVAELDVDVSAILTEQATQDVEPEPGDSAVAELEAAVSQILTEQVTEDIEPGDSVDVAALDAADSPITTEQATLEESSEGVVTDVGSKETDEETTLPPSLDTTNESPVGGALVASDNNAENSPGSPEPTVEDSLQATDVLVVETSVAGDAEVVDKPDIDENTGNQSPADSVRGGLPPRRPTSCSSCCGLFEALWR